LKQAEKDVNPDSKRFPNLKGQDGGNGGAEGGWTE